MRVVLLPPHVHVAAHGLRAAARTAVPRFRRSQEMHDLCVLAKSRQKTVYYPQLEERPLQELGHYSEVHTDDSN